ncbi:MAG: transporter substrate-binding domain-containing protein [Rhodospirillaceae bacterium]|nr:transporter substrate-binding domain-containing protein [Rhodospirillaceae bacterium]
MIRHSFAMVAAVFLSVVLSLQASDAAAKKPITICGTPWGKLGGENLPGQGFVPDIVMRVFRHAGYEIKTELVPWPRCVEHAKKQKYDLIASAWQGPNFAPHFDYLNVILHDTINFITLEDAALKSGSMTSFHGKKVGLVREAGGLEALFNDQPKIAVHRVAKLKSLPKMLAHGRIDAIVTDPVSLNEFVKKMDPPFGHKLVAQQPPLKINFNSPMIAKGHPDKSQIMADFDRAYKDLKGKGLYQNLIKIHDLQVQYPKK